MINYGPRTLISDKVKPRKVRVPKIVTYGSPCDQNPDCERTNGARITADKFKQFWVSFYNGQFCPSAQASGTVI